jgi:branched-chain amino acid transport system ATP-binding protein
LSFSIPQGQLSGLIGPNGAGKTTVFNMLTGVYRPTQGEILLSGKNIVGMKPYEINHLGMARTFQNIRLFKNLSVLQNVLIATHQHISYGLFDTAFLSKKFQNQETEMHAKALSLLKIFHLENKAHERASSLPYGEQRKLDLEFHFGRNKGLR